MTALSDGTALRDLTKIMSNPTEARQAFDASHQTLPTEISINSFLIDTGTQRILVDTGSRGIVRTELIGYSWVPIPYGVILQDEQVAQL
jgi:hypothetical protein